MWRGARRLGRGGGTRSLGPKRNSSTNWTTGDHVSEQAWVSGSPCVHWTRGPWLWTWSACLLPCHPSTWSGTLRTQREDWLPERLSPSASPFPLTCFCGPFLPNRSKGERRIERERERYKAGVGGAEWRGVGPSMDDSNLTPLVSWGTGDLT